ncbi:MAG: DUF2029 domain-containing protein [Chloroflexi bacterium]|nr:DUF2029 domain-containing protein [Chloroflexota bacterium]
MSAPVARGSVRGARAALGRIDPQVARRAIRDGLSVVGLGMVWLIYQSPGPGYDFFAYWSVDPADPYAVREGFGAFHYTPPFVWLAGPLRVIPWPFAYWVWAAILVAVLVWLARDWALAWLAFPPVASELYHGNIHLLIAAFLVTSLRRPAVYLFLPLSKVTPGVSALWFLARREWRSLAIALGATAVVVLISGVIAPGAWLSWLAHISSDATRAPNLIPIPVVVRLPFAAAIVLLAARWDRPWLLAPALVLSLPLLWVHGFAILVALTPLVRWQRSRG